MNPTYGDFEYWDNYLKKTVDDGQNWTNINLDNNQTASSIKFINENEGYIGSIPELFKTDDEGNTIELIDNLQSIAVVDLDVVNNVIWTCGVNAVTCDCPNYIIRTEISNDTVSSTFFENRYNDGTYSYYELFQAIDFYNDNVGYVVEANGFIRKNPTGSMGINSFENDIFEIFPNPSNGKISIQNKDNKIKLVSYSIIDLQGKEVISEKELTGNTINATQLSDGSYILRLKDNNNNYYTQKLIIQK